jgi:hypothetical protein
VNTAATRQQLYHMTATWQLAEMLLDLAAAWRAQALSLVCSAVDTACELGIAITLCADTLLAGRG